MKKQHNVGTVQKSNRRIAGRDTIDTPNTQIHDRSRSWLDTATSMKRCVMGPNHLGKVVKELM
jgi:hypothetical protein